jgi:hypothetical protein
VTFAVRRHTLAAKRCQQTTAANKKRCSMRICVHKPADGHAQRPYCGYLMVGICGGSPWLLMSQNLSFNLRPSQKRRRLLGSISSTARDRRSCNSSIGRPMSLSRTANMLST